MINFLRKIKYQIVNFKKMTKLTQTNGFWLVLPKCSELGENIEFPSSILLVRPSDLIFSAKIFDTLVLKAKYTSNFLFFDYNNEIKNNKKDEKYIFIIKENKAEKNKHEITLQY